MTTKRETKSISILGLGQMGKKLAQLYRDAGFNVWVWNRSSGKAKDLQVSEASSVVAAIAESDLILICVLDNTATLAMLNTIQDKSLLKGKTIVNLTTGSPAEAQLMERLLNDSGGHYLNGAIQVAPDQMGQPDTTILMAGDNKTFERYVDELKVLGGNLKHLADQAAASPAMDLATLTWLYGSYVGLLYGVKLSQSFGLKLDDFRDIIGDIVPGFTGFFKHEINMIAKDHYEVTQSPLSISVIATKRIAETFERLPVAQEFPKMMAEMLRKAGERYGKPEQEVAVLLKVIGE